MTGTPKTEEQVCLVAPAQAALSTPLAELHPASPAVTNFLIWHGFCVAGEAGTPEPCDNFHMSEDCMVPCSSMCINSSPFRFPQMWDFSALSHFKSCAGFHILHFFNILILFP
jgi:hypothetical protein